MALKRWHLGAVGLAVVAAAAALSLGRPPLTPPTPTVSPRLQTIEFAQQQADALVVARYWREAQPQSARATAISHVRWAIPDVESYSSDNVYGNPSDPGTVSASLLGADYSSTDSGYSGMTFLLLKDSYDWGFPPQTWVDPTDPGYPAAVRGVVPSATRYCVLARSGGWYAWKLGPAGTILASRSPALVCQTLASSK